MTLFISTLLYALSVLPIISLMTIRQPSRYLCAFFVTFFGEIILTGNILGLIKQINNINAWFIVQVVFLILSWGLWIVLKRPALFSFTCVRPAWRSLKLLQKLALGGLALFVSAGYITLAYLIMVVPPNNTDSMVVHLVRVGYWLQHNSFVPWNSLIERQVIYPFNAQIIVLWSILLQGTDKFAAFLQFFSVLFTALGIYCIGREIGGNRYQAGLSALFYLTFPQVILQATTTQDDLVITCFLILGSYFFLRWYQKSYSDKWDLFAATSGFMIAVGIKPTSFYFFIGFAVFLVLLFCLRKIKISPLLQLSAACLAAFVVLSSFSYINNQIYFHTPLGPAEFVQSESGIRNANILDKGIINSSRFFYQFISLDGIPSAISKPILNGKVSAASMFPNLFDSSLKYIKDPGKPFNPTTLPGMNEDFSWFGPVSFLLLIPAFIVGMIKAIKAKDLRIVFLLVVPFFMLSGIAILRPGWDPYQGRYFNPGIAITMPLVVFLLKDKPFHQLLTIAISILAVFVLINSVVINDSKPLLTQATMKRAFSAPGFSCRNSFFSKYECYFGNIITPFLPAKADIYGLNELQRMTYSSQNQYPVVSLVYKEIPPHSRIGIRLLNGDWEYPFFGRHFEYQLYPINYKKNLQEFSLQNQSVLDYLIVHSNGDQVDTVDSSYILQENLKDSKTDSTWTVYKSSH
jgi:4-amino-4-deoxy-L-arabinose transferase-like glycosyltransferase